MPLINYVCSCGEGYKKYFKTAKTAPPTIDCKCGLKAKKSFGATSSAHLTIIDNGLMAKKLEIDINIMEINDVRARTDFSED